VLPSPEEREIKQVKVYQYRHHWVKSRNFIILSSGEEV